MSQKPSGSSFIRPQLRNQPAFPANRVDTSLHRMQWNESPFDYPMDLREEVLQRLARIPWSCYPLGLRSFDVIDALAQSLGLNNDQVIVGNGSTDILRTVIYATLQAGDHLVTLFPTFGSYANHARQVGAEVHTVALDPSQNFALPVDTILDTARQNDAKLIAICAPNNPTGTVFPIEQLRRIAQESDALVFFDAAYAEFCGQDLRPFLAETDRLIVAHTLSKAYSMAGVRVGYAITSPEIAKELQKLIFNFTLSPFSEAAAIVALQHKDRFMPMIAAVVNERERLATALSQLPGVTVYPSGTNFVLANVGRKGKAVQEYLRGNHHILIADMGMYPGYEQFVRISVGAPEENNLVVKGIADYLATVPE